MNYIVPDYAIMSEGKVVQSGDKDLALTLEEKGYDVFKRSKLGNYGYTTSND